jgi:hypothetical protein
MNSSLDSLSTSSQEKVRSPGAFSPIKVNYFVHIRNGAIPPLQGLLNRVEAISYRPMIPHPEAGRPAGRDDSRIRAILRQCMIAVQRIVAIEMVFKRPLDYQNWLKERGTEVSKEVRLAQLSLATKKEKSPASALEAQKIHPTKDVLVSFLLPLPHPFWKKKKKKKETKEEEQEEEPLRD